MGIKKTDPLSWLNSTLDGRVIIQRRRGWIRDRVPRQLTEAMGAAESDDCLALGAGTYSHIVVDDVSVHPLPPSRPAK